MSKPFFVAIATVVFLILTHAAPLQAETGDEDAVMNIAVIDGSNNSKIMYSMVGLTQPGSNRILEGWLVSDNGIDRLSTGKMQVLQDGTVDHTYWSPDNKSLLRIYSKIEITVEPDPDPFPGTPSDEGLWIAKLPVEAVDDIRLLLTTWSNDSVRDDSDVGTEGNLTDLLQRLDAAIFEAQFACEHAVSTEELHWRIQRSINLIEGINGPNYDPLAGPQIISEELKVKLGDPTEWDYSVGIFTSLISARSHAQKAAADAPHSTQVVNHGKAVEASLTNSEGWLVEARDQALIALATNELMAAKIQCGPARDFIIAAKTGRDMDNDGTVEATHKEGGVTPALKEARLMATFVLEPGKLPSPIQLGSSLPKTGDSILSSLPAFALTSAAVLVSVGLFLLLWKHRMERR